MPKSNPSIVVCKLPKAGLGNQLFPLMKAFVFGKINDLPVKVINYHQVKIGPWLRGEKNKRTYLHFFRFQHNIIRAMIERIFVSIPSSPLIQDPRVEKITPQKNTRYEFNAIPHWENYFKGLKEHREMVVGLLDEIINPRIKSKLKTIKSPCIGVHIRMGDFRKLKQGEDFSAVGAVRTPLQYFVNVINGIREIHGSDLPVSIFTDGYKEELSEMLLLENTSVVEGYNDLVDLLLLSKSAIIVCSAGSTFSYWAGFLADVPLIMHPDHLHQPLRPDSINACYYEGPFNTSNALLRQNIKAIHC